MKKGIIGIVNLFVVILLTSCSSESNTINAIDSYTGQPGFLKSAKFITNTGDVNSNHYYTYIGNKIDKKIIYNATNSAVLFTHVYEYQSDKISKMSILNSSSTNFVNSVQNFTYDEQNRVIEHLFTYPNAADENYKYIYNYDNIASNDIGVKTYNNSTSSGYILTKERIIRTNANDEVLSYRDALATIDNPTTVYQYDTKVSPMKDIIGFSKNYTNFAPGEGKFSNVISQVNPNASAETISVAYEYNDANKPTKATYTNNDGVYLIVEFTYF